MDNVAALQKIGFSENEATVYLVLLELGESPVTTIAEKAGLQRTYCYDLLKNLAEKGLAYAVDRRGKRRYAARRPQLIKKMLLNKLDRFDEVLPSLEGLYQKGPHRPHVRYFEAKEGLQAVHDEALTEAKEIYYYGAGEDWLHTFPDYYQFVQSLVRSEITIKDLVKKMPETLKYQELYQPPKQEMRFIKESWHLPADCAIWGNKVAWLSYTDEMHAVIIESNPVTESMRTTFHILWEQASVK